MTAGALDTIVNAFVQALLAGQMALARYSLGILGFAGIVAWCLALWPALANQEHGLAAATFVAIRIAVYYWISVSLAAGALALFGTFLQWGTAAGGGGFTAAMFLSPSSMLDAGFRAARPVQDFLLHFTGPGVLWNAHIIIPYMLAYWITVLSFALIAFHLIVTIIEFHMAVMVGSVLIPWGALHHTAFLAEFGIAWIVAGLIRVLLTASILSIAIPLFATLAYTTTPTKFGDPTFYSAAVFAITSAIFAILAWQIPSRASTVGGRGMALGLTGGMLVPHTMTQVIRAAGSASVRGTSRLLTGIRA